MCVQDVERIYKASDSTLVAAGGEYSDFQKIQQILGDLTGRDRVRFLHIFSFHMLLKQLSL